MGAASSSSTRINRLLADWGQGNEEARDALIPVVYGEGGPIEVMELLGCPTTFRSVPQ